MSLDGPDRSYPVLGLCVDAVDPERACARIARWIDAGERHYVCVANVHVTMEARRDASLRAGLDAAGMTVPDGMPLVWIGRWLGFREVRRTYGPDLMLDLCAAAARRGDRVFLLGGAAGVAETLTARLTARFPGLQVVGTHAPAFRPPEPEEDEALVRLLNAAAADIVFVGLGCPRQERWMIDHRARLQASVLIGVGAAFDFLSGRVPQAPRWMMRVGLEWSYRLAQEPRRLWHRYLVYNPLFLFYASVQLLGLGGDAGPASSPRCAAAGGPRRAASQPTTIPDSSATPTAARRPAGE